ncbi:unnamed protein product [Adineta steineri]|uniref:Limiting CO2-inducible protein B/C beta carbonyic anhydrase domain-containing protein n=1 Tax=Adineta steineri TaxID=433720 RepID=A0A813WCS9_9BILA|nr:unnamed protein product [Adineta steineri]CAF1148405.1 unnamed protein product [Adineta steineri]CAF1292074.1 unnamed protein product [Adineta steineri]
MSSSFTRPGSASHVARSSWSNPSSRISSAKHYSGNTCPYCHHPVTMNEGSGAAFQASLHKLFPGAYGLEEFVFLTKQTLVAEGFYPHVNTFVCLGLCRDEITNPFELAVEAMWGQAFICGSLGGMLFCGKTGFSAAHHHAPEAGYFVYYCFTHIAIDHEGSVGSVYRSRSGMKEKTTACGALAAFTAEIASNKLNLNFDEDDIEMSMLKKHIITQTGLSTDATNAPDLFKVTMAAYKTITMDLERHVRSDSEKFKDRKYALFTGVQIHGPNGTDYCWIGKASLLRKGILLPLVIASDIEPLSSTGPSNPTSH